MKKMIAAVRDKQSGEILNIESEYESKAAFKNDLNKNGYSVIGRISVEGEKENMRSRLYDRGFRAR
jgi:ABC-type proline/glycine betaine transport system substrate-binding protein